MARRLATTAALVLAGIGLSASTAMAGIGPIQLSHEQASFKGSKGENCGGVAGCYPTVLGTFTISGSAPGSCYELWYRIGEAYRPASVARLQSNPRDIHCGDQSVTDGASYMWGPLPEAYLICRVTSAGDKLSCGAEQPN
ncbi:hypothetical protein JOF53_001858 [Crossiella equi]|uniref:Secreted protein n=1 Tax=Crossiella equi TaxID=130796 RepID=A0ABS5A9K4_9PSEU|nr:hypothetical protein [Crossiella equi]MBP2472986.1 hypothetical protein [Crossiella equi]